MTWPVSGRPQRAWSGLGVFDRMRVDLPAARMIAATLSAAPVAIADESDIYRLFQYVEISVARLRRTSFRCGECQHYKHLEPPCQAEGGMFPVPRPRVSARRELQQ